MSTAVTLTIGSLFTGAGMLDRGDADGDHEWHTFDTWTEAITYANRKARQA